MSYIIDFFRFNLLLDPSKTHAYPAQLRADHDTVASTKTVATQHLNSTEMTNLRANLDIVPKTSSPLHTLLAAPLATLQESGPHLGSPFAITSAPVAVELKPKTLPISPELQIVNPQEYIWPPSFMDKVVGLSRDTDLDPLWECYKYFSKDDPDEHALLAVKNGSPAGVVFGHELPWRPDYFELSMICLNSEERSTKHAPAKEKIGLKLLFAAMEKAKSKLNKRFLTLKYDPGYGQNTNEHCARRKAFYHSLRDYGIEFTCENYDFYDDLSENYCRSQTVTYDLSTFDYTKAMNALTQKLQRQNYTASK